MIGHGGLYSVKESLAFGVPMILCPLGKDNPGNAARVAYHGAGIMLEPATLSPSVLSEAVRRIDRQPEIRATARRFATILQDADRRSPATDVIAQIVQSSSAAAR